MERLAPLMFALPGNEALAARLAPASGCETGELLARRFPDGESCLRYLTPVSGRQVVLVCTLDRPDAKVMQLYFAASIARELGATRVGLVLPYLAYMRQDARFQEGEGITSLHFGRLLSACCDWVATVDPHLHRHRSLDEVYSVANRVVHAAPAISEWIRQHVERAVIVGPDGESAQWVEQVARDAGCEFTVLEKIRSGDREVDVSRPDGNRWRGATPVLVDDIASTARTMIAAIGRLRDCGLPAPVCIAVHPVFADDAYAELSAAGPARVVSCNTIAHPSNGIDICEPLAQAVRELSV